MSLFLSTPMFSDAGFLGRPGIVIISPQITTINSSKHNLTSLIGTSCSDGAPINNGSVEKLYWVLAMQIG